MINKNKCSKVSHSFLVHGKSIDDPVTIANTFNDYFINIGPTLVSQITECKNDSSFRRFMPQPNLNSMFINMVTKSEVHKIISKLKDGSPGHDRITSSYVKLIAKNMSLPLTQAINRSLSQGVFPTELKIAKVIPLFISNDASLFTNYRPISLLPISQRFFNVSCIIDYITT